MFCNQIQRIATKCGASLNTDKGVTIADSQVSFEKHINKICGKAKAKLSALTRVTAFMNFTQKKMLMNTSSKAQLNYCPLVWMLHSSKLNNRINKLHERCLRIRYNNNPRTFRTFRVG